MRLRLLLMQSLQYQSPKCPLFRGITRLTRTFRDLFETYAFQMKPFDSTTFVFTRNHFADKSFPTEAIQSFLFWNHTFFWFNPFKIKDILDPNPQICLLVNSIPTVLSLLFFSSKITIRTNISSSDSLGIGSSSV
jgi:hypothetical protein